MAKPLSRPARWNAAVAAGQDALQEARDAQETLDNAKANLEQALNDLDELRGEYEEWKDNLPDSLQQSPVAEKLEAVCDISLGWGTDDDLDDAENMLSEAENADLPRGFGND